MVYISNMLNPIDYSIVKFVDLLPARIVSLLNGIATKRSFRQGERIERFGEPAFQLSIIHSGLVRLGLDGADGSRFNLSILGPGSSFGETALFLDLPVQFDAHCETDVELITLSKDQVMQLLRDESEFALAALKIAHARSHTMLEHMSNTMNLPLQVRAAILLSQMLDEAADGKAIFCRQVDLAHALAVSRVSMGKALKTLEGQKLIKRAYGKILIPSKTRLKAWLAVRNNAQ